MNALDRLFSYFAPKAAAKRIAYRTAARHYDAATVGRRTNGWRRNRGDVDSLSALAGPELRMHARDLDRNNSWARRGKRVIANNTVGWGIVPKAVEVEESLGTALASRWKQWAGTKECDADDTQTFYGLQHQAMKALFTDGELLFRRRNRLPQDGLSLPLQIQTLEIDYLDTNRDGPTADGRGYVVQGVEYNAIDKRVAYWIFRDHPGSSTSTGESYRVPASEIIHVRYVERPGQTRGFSWLATAIVNLKDLDAYEDAELMKAKIASCFVGVVTDADGSGAGIGEEDEDDDVLESFEPGTFSYLTPGTDIKFASPPAFAEGSFAQRNLRKVAAGLGVTYEDLTGDYSQVNFSSARMARLSHWANVRDWQYNMLIPQLCDGVWAWFVEALITSGELKNKVAAEWTTPPMPMIEPDREGRAYQNLIRSGVMTFSDMIREQGGDPVAHWNEYAADMKMIDDRKIKLDSDVRAVSQAGLTQERAGGQGGGKPPAGEAAEERSRSAALEDIEIPIDLGDFQ